MTALVPAVGQKRHSLAVTVIDSTELLGVQWACSDGHCCLLVFAVRGVRKLERALIDLEGGLPGDLPLELEALQNIRKNPRVEIGCI